MQPPLVIARRNRVAMYGHLRFYRHFSLIIPAVPETLHARTVNSCSPGTTFGLLDDVVIVLIKCNVNVEQV